MSIFDWKGIFSWLRGVIQRAVSVWGVDHKIFQGYYALAYLKSDIAKGRFKTKLGTEQQTSTFVVIWLNWLSCSNRIAVRGCIVPAVSDYPLHLVLPADAE
jgi:hypothetical protein